MVQLRAAASKRSTLKSHFTKEFIPSERTKPGNPRNFFRATHSKLLLLSQVTQHSTKRHVLFVMMGVVDNITCSGRPASTFKMAEKPEDLSLPASVISRIIKESVRCLMKKEAIRT